MPKKRESQRIAVDIGSKKKNNRQKIEHQTDVVVFWVVMVM